MSVLIAPSCFAPSPYSYFFVWCPLEFEFCWSFNRFRCLWTNNMFFVFNFIFVFSQQFQMLWEMMLISTSSVTLSFRLHQDIQPFVHQTKFKSQPKNYSIKLHLLNGAPIFRFVLQTKVSMSLVSWVHHCSTAQGSTRWRQSQKMEWKTYIFDWLVLWHDLQGNKEGIEIKRQMLEVRGWSGRWVGWVMGK